LKKMLKDLPKLVEMGVPANKGLSCFLVGVHLGTDDEDHRAAFRTPINGTGYDCTVYSLEALLDERTTTAKAGATQEVRRKQTPKAKRKGAASKPASKRKNADQRGLEMLEQFREEEEGKG